VKYLEFMALCRTNVALSSFSLPAQRWRRNHHSIKVCLDERLALVALHRRADPVDPGWKVISIGHLFLGKKGIPATFSAERRSIIPLLTKGHRIPSQEWAGLARL
jgi:hypothetical protein